MAHHENQKITKPPVTVSPLYHRGARRIKVHCPFDEAVISKIKQVEGRRWSKTHHCWHVPYTSEAFQHLKKMFEVEISPEFSGKKQNEEPSKSPKKEAREVICLGTAKQ